MKPPQICVAGIEPQTGEHIRPVTGRTNPLTRSLLEAEGGPLAIGARVDLGKLTPRPAAPEVEDHLFWPERARRVGMLGPSEYLNLIDSVCRDSLEEIFGSELTPDGWGLSLPEGQGIASLGCLRVPDNGNPELSISRYGKVTIRLRGPEKPCFLKVNDLRYYEQDQATPVSEKVENARERIRQGVPLRLMVGLTRPWAKEESEPRHWLQVNGLCFEDSPLARDQ